MLPETMFVMERIRRNEAEKCKSAFADPLKDWPSTRLDYAALWFSGRMNAWEGSRSRKRRDPVDSVVPTWPLQAILKVFISARLLGRVAAPFIARLYR